MTTLDERVRRVKNLAAQRATELYGRTIQEELADVPSEFLAGVLCANNHGHELVIVNCGKPWLLLRTVWRFDGEPSLINAALAKMKPTGQG